MDADCVFEHHPDLLDKTDAILCCQMLHVLSSQPCIRINNRRIPVFICGCSTLMDDAVSFSIILIRRLSHHEPHIITVASLHDAMRAWLMSTMMDGVIVDTACTLRHRLMIASGAQRGLSGRTWAVRSSDGIIRVAVMSGMSDPIPESRNERVVESPPVDIRTFLVVAPESGAIWPSHVVIVCEHPAAAARIIDPCCNPPIHYNSLESAMSEFPGASVIQGSVPRIIMTRSNPSIAVYWHVGALDKTVSPLIFKDQNHVLRCSGILDAADRLNVGFVGSCYDPKTWRPHPRFRILFHDPNPLSYEVPTLNAMLDDARSTHDDYLILYFHTKGASSMTRFNRRAVFRWRKIMEWWNIVMFRRCIDLMMTHSLDALGGNLINMSPGGHPVSEFRVNCEHSCHYSGNFWWSRASHVRRLVALAPPLNERHRLKAENWILSALPNMCAGESFRYHKVHMYDYVQSYTTASTGHDHFRILSPLQK